MVGNPRAVAENKRFMEKNLNRIIHPVRVLTFTCSPTTDGSLIGGGLHQTWFAREEQLYEARRARLVARMGLSSDQWLDVHSTSSPCTAYALPTGNPQSEELAERLDIGTVQQILVE